MSTASQLQVVIHASQTQYHCDDDVAHSRMYASCETNMNHRLTLYNVTCLPAAPTSSAKYHGILW